MKLRFVVLFFLATLGKCSGKGGLEGLIEDVSVVSRLVNGIAIQSESLESERSIKTVVAELLDVRSAAFLSKLARKEVETLKEDWSQFAEAVKKVPTISNDAVQESESGMGMISKLVEGKEILKGLEDGTFDNPSQTITDLVNKVDDNERADGADFSKYKFGGLVDALRFVHGTKPDRLSQTELATIGKLNSDVPRCLDMITWNYTQKFSNLLNLKKMSHLTADARKLAEMAELFLEKFDKIKSMESNWNTLSNGVSELSKVANFPKDLNKTSQSLVDVNQFMKSLAVQKAKKRYLTVGIPRGTEDLRRISEDLNGKFLKKVISEGKSLEGLKKALDPLNKFSEKMKSVEDQWKKVMASKEALEASEESGKMLGKLVEDGKNAPKNEDVGQSLSKAANCLNQLTKMTNDPDIAGFTLMVDALETVEKNVMAFETAMKETQEDPNFTTAVAHLNSLMTIFRTGAKPLEAWNQVRNFTDMSELVTFINGTANRLAAVDGVVFRLDSSQLKNLSAIETVMKSFDGTNLVGALSCLDQESVDFPKIKALLGIGQVVAELNTKAKTMDDTNDYLKEVSQLKKQLAEISKSTWKIGRARRATGNKLRKLKNARELSRDLGRGLEVMREFSNIQAKQQNVLNAVNCPAEVKSLVDEMPGALDTWGEEQQQLMLALLKDLKKFDDSATRLPRQDMLHISAVFEEANKVQGVDIDSSFFADPVSSDLSTTQFKSVAADYEQLSHLDLNFAQHHTYLKAASMSLSPLQSYFDTFFGIDRRPKKDKEVASKESSSNVASTVLIVLAVLFCVTLIVAPSVYYIRRYINKKYRWKRRDRHWIYADFFKPTDSVASFLMAVKDDKLETVRSYIRNGQFINVYGRTVTALHLAVENLNPKMMELLITNGADPKLRNDKKMTPEQLLKEMMGKSMDEKLKVKTEKCQKIFDKYRDKIFQSPVNGLLPKDKFSVELRCESKKAEAFKKAYPKNIFKLDDELSPQLTHIVVDVDKEGIYEFDGSDASSVFSTPILVKSSWLKECVESSRNFYEDYNHRVTRVRFNGKVYATVDEWKKWMRGWAIVPLYGMGIYTDSSLDKDLTKRMTNFAYDMSAKNLNYSKLMNAFENEKQPVAHWFPELAPLLFIYPDSKVGTKMEDLYPDSVLKYGIRDKMTQMNESALYEMLLALNGWTELEKKLKFEPSLEKSAKDTEDEEGSAMTSSAINSTVTDKKSKK